MKKIINQPCKDQPWHPWNLHMKRLDVEFPVEGYQSILFWCDYEEGMQEKFSIEEFPIKGKPVIFERGPFKDMYRLSLVPPLNRDQKENIYLIEHFIRK